LNIPDEFIDKDGCCYTLSIGIPVSNVSIHSTDYTLLSSDNVVVFTETATATLPPATGSGTTYRIVARESTVTIQGDGNDTVKGNNTQTITSHEDLIITDTQIGIWE